MGSAGSDAPASNPSGAQRPAQARSATPAKAAGDSTSSTITSRPSRPSALRRRRTNGIRSGSSRHRRHRPSRSPRDRSRRYGQASAAPQPPPITVKFIGVLDRADGSRLALFADCSAGRHRSHAREGHGGRTLSAREDWQGIGDHRAPRRPGTHHTGRRWAGMREIGVGVTKQRLVFVFCSRPRSPLRMCGRRGVSPGRGGSDSVTGTLRSRTSRKRSRKTRQPRIQDRARARDAERGARTSAAQLEEKDQLDAALIE